jgi:hypothetical protein
MKTQPEHMKKQLLLLISCISLATYSFGQNDLFISMYVCGTANNKAIELYNPTSNAIVLTGVYRLSLFENGVALATLSANLKGSVAAHSTFVFANGQVTVDSVYPQPPSLPYATYPCDTALQHRANQLDTGHFYAFSYFNGDDALVLEKFNGPGYPLWISVDIFACIGEWPTSGTTHSGWWNIQPYDAATPGKAWTKLHSLVRKPGITNGVKTNPQPHTWNPAAEWDSLPNNTYPTGIHMLNQCSATHTITADPNQPGNYVLTNNAWGKGTLHYDWNWGDGTPHDTTATPTHTFASSALTNICLTIKDSAGCTSTQCDTLTVARLPYWTSSTHTTVTVIKGGGLITGMQHINPMATAQLFPNPNNGSFSVVATHVSGRPELIIVNLLGEQIFKIVLSQERTSVDLNAVAKGIYFYNIISESKLLTTGKIIVE